MVLGFNLLGDTLRDILDPRLRGSHGGPSGSTRSAPDNLTSSWPTIASIRTVNFASLDEEDSSFERSRVVVLPVPYDSTVTARAGTRDGPRAIIEASADMELYDVGLGIEPCRHGIHTLPELAPHTGSPEAMCDAHRGGRRASCSTPGSSS